MSQTSFEDGNSVDFQERKTKLPVYITTNEEPAGSNFARLTLTGEGNTTDNTGATTAERCGWYSVDQLKVIVFLTRRPLSGGPTACLPTYIPSGGDGVPQVNNS